MIVLAIDPGREKCGIAVVSSDSIHMQEVVERDVFLPKVKALAAQYDVGQIVLGNGTGSREFCEVIQAYLPNCPVYIIDEHLSTEEARREYWKVQKPRGWRRILPTTMQVPPEPYDDYVAVILARRFLKKGSSPGP